MDWQKKAKRVHELLALSGKPLSWEEIVGELVGDSEGILAGEMRYALLCDDGLKEVEEGVYGLAGEIDDGESVSKICIEGNHDRFVERVREAFEKLGFESDSSLLGQKGYPDIGLISGEWHIAVDCWESRRGTVDSNAMTLAEIHGKKYQHVMGRDVNGILIVTGYFTQEAIDSTYFERGCGLLRSTGLDLAIDFIRRFELGTDELVELLCLRGSLDIRLESLIEGRRNDTCEMAAILRVLQEAGEPIPIWDIGRGLTEKFGLLMSSDRMSSLLEKMKSPPLELLEETDDGWIHRQRQSGDDRR